jgi:hypothetical protein
MTIYDRLDENGEGEMPQEKLRVALRQMGEMGRARKMMSTIDRNGDGIVDRGEWEFAVDEILDGTTTLNLGDDFLGSFLEKIDKKAAQDNSAGVGNNVPEYCLLSFQSRFRVTWDIFLGFLLLHVAIVVPFELGFLEDSRGSALEILGLVIHILFMVDVVLNFRTTYQDSNAMHVTSGRRIAWQYIRTWFIIDLVSSLPFEYISRGVLPSLNMTKLAKSGKAFKFLKMLRFAKATRFSERFSDYLAVSGGTLIWGMLLVICAIMLLCHWLACIMPLVGDGFLTEYPFTGETTSSKYCVAVYWAVTTITTVGYGDVLPATDGERLYTIAAMLIGGGMYSCVIGNVFVILNNRNLNAQACIQRLREVLDFLNHHELPKELRHRVWHYHRKHLKGKNASDSFSVLGDLSPELRQAVSFVIVHEDVRSNPLFEDLPSIVIPFLASVVKDEIGERGDILAQYGDYGYAFSVIIEGSAVTDFSGKPLKEDGEALALCESSSASQVILPGDSYGEEILLGLTRTYVYTIVACQRTVISQIPSEEFMMHFQSMPDLLSRMQKNFSHAGGLYILCSSAQQSAASPNSPEFRKRSL